MRSIICTLADFGGAIWCLGIMLWYFGWWRVYSRTASQKLSSWMFRWETPMLFLFMIVSFGVLLYLVEMSECFSKDTENAPQ